MYLPGPMAVLIERYKGQSKPPDVALIGSSLMRRPFHACDEIELGPIDYKNYSQATALAHRLSEGREKTDVFNLARDGAMVTDALLIQKHLLRGKLKPKVLVYGLAPRDFVDSLLINERSTDTFRCLLSFIDALNNGDCFTANRNELLQLIFQQAVPLYAAHQGMQTKTDEVAKAIFYRDVSTSGSRTSASVDSADTDSERYQQLLLAALKNTKSRVAVGASQKNAVKIISKAAHETKEWRFSLFQYNMRYFQIDQSRFDRQEKALTRLLETAKARDIKVLVVNMPLALVNLDLMPPDLYPHYLERVKQVCSKRNASFLDLQTDKSFNRSNFDDIAHLNASGGKKLIARITPTILKLLDVEKNSTQRDTGSGVNAYKIEHAARNK